MSVGKALCPTPLQPCCFGWAFSIPKILILTFLIPENQTAISTSRFKNSQFAEDKEIVVSQMAGSSKKASASRKSGKSSEGASSSWRPSSGSPLSPKATVSAPQAKIFHAAEGGGRPCLRVREARSSAVSGRIWTIFLCGSIAFSRPSDWEGQRYKVDTSFLYKLRNAISQISRPKRAC